MPEKCSVAPFTSRIFFKDVVVAPLLPHPMVGYMNWVVFCSVGRMELYRLRVDAIL